MKTTINTEVKERILKNASELQDALNKLEHALYNPDRWDAWIEDRCIHLYNYGVNGGEYIFNKKVSMFLIKDRTLKSALSSKFARRLAYMSLDRYVDMQFLTERKHNPELETMLEDMEEFISDDIENKVEYTHYSMGYME